MIKYFINLTNGIEAIPKLWNENINFIRIQSTTLERNNWYKLFIDLDHNLLMWLALGAECRIYDFGTNRSISKTIYKGIPIIKYCLNKYWFGYEANEVMIGRNPTNQKNYVEKEIYQKYFLYHGKQFLDAKIQLDIKFKYYRKLLNGNNAINLIGISKSTSHDSDIDFYKTILSCYITK